MNETIEKLTKLAYDQASTVLLGTDKELLTCFALLKEDKHMDIIGTPWKDDKEKQDAIVAIALAILSSKKPVLAYSMLSECWTSHYQGDEKKRADRPEHDPQRRECVICLASTGKERKFSSWLIERDAQGRCASLTENNSPGEFTSWMTDALDKAMQLAKVKNAAQRNQGNN